MTNTKTPNRQTIKYRSITEGATCLATLESGKNLLIDEISEPDYGRLKDDKAVREAINWAVDRQGIVQQLFIGVHHVGIGPLSEGAFGRLDELEKRYMYGPKKCATCSWARTA